MKLPDFTQAVEFIRLRQQMGVISIPTLPKVDFVRVTKGRRKVVEIDEKDKQLLEDLKGAVAVRKSDLVVQEGLLTYGGRKVVAYIRDQRKRINEYARTSDYRFHLLLSPAKYYDSFEWFVASNRYGQPQRREAGF